MNVSGKGWPSTPLRRSSSGWIVPATSALRLFVDTMSWDLETSSRHSACIWFSMHHLHQVGHPFALPRPPLKFIPSYKDKNHGNSKRLCCD